jgi:hypothetical protein
MASSHADAAWQTGIPATLVLVSVAWSEPLFPQGGPPLRTDDPGTPGDGNWEVNLAATADKRDSRLLLEAPLVDINYGVGERIQLKFEIPWLFLDEDDGPSKNGLGNSQVGVKWRFLDQAEEWLDVSVYPQVEFNNPSSSARRDLVDDGTAWTLPIELEKSFGPVSVNPEIGYVLLEDEDEWLYGLALGYSPSSGIELLAELHGPGRAAVEHPPERGCAIRDWAWNQGHRL